MIIEACAVAYNGQRWVERCGSLDEARAQFEKMKANCFARYSAIHVGERELLMRIGFFETVAEAYGKEHKIPA